MSMEQIFKWFMMLIYFSAIFLMTYVLINSKDFHPMKNLMYFLLYMFILCMFLYILKYKSLIIFMIMIIFISGLMILFAYFVSLSNKSWLSYFSYMNMFIMMLLLIYILFFFMDYLLDNYDNIIYSMNLYRDKNINLLMIYQYPNLFLLFFMVLFLLFILIMSYKMSYPKKKTYRFFKEDENDEK